MTPVLLPAARETGQGAATDVVVDATEVEAADVEAADVDAADVDAAEVDAAEVDAAEVDAAEVVVEGSVVGMVGIDDVGMVKTDVVGIVVCIVVVVEVIIVNAVVVIVKAVDDEVGTVKTELVVGPTAVPVLNSSRISEAVENNIFRYFCTINLP